MIIKSTLVAVLASAMGLAVVGCMSAEPAEENVEDTSQALTTGITFDPTNFVLTHTLNGTTWTADRAYPPGNSSVTYNVPCNATQVGFQASTRSRPYAARRSGLTDASIGSIEGPG